MDSSRDSNRDIWGFIKIRGTILGGFINKGYNMLGSILGTPHVGKVPYRDNGKENGTTIMSLVFRI